MFADVGKVQIEPPAVLVPAPRSIAHLCTGSSSRRHLQQPPQPTPPAAGRPVRGITVHPSQAVPKLQSCARREAETAPSLTVLFSGQGAVEQAKRRTALLPRCKKLLQVSKKRKQMAKSWVILFPTPPFPMEIQRRKKNPEQSAVWIQEPKQERKEERSHSSLQKRLSVHLAFVQ